MVGDKDWSEQESATINPFPGPMRLILDRAS